MHGVLGLGNLILLKRFLGFANEPKAIAKIGAHVRIVGAVRDCLLVMLNRVCPVMPVVVPVPEYSRGVGGIIGAFAGYEIRRRLVSGLNIKDIFIAALEDVVTIGLACLFVTR